MLDWLNQEIDSQLLNEVAPIYENLSDQSIELMEIMFANHGRVEMLRRRYPHLAKFIDPPPLGRGKKHSEPWRKPSSPAKLAASLAGRIRTLLQQKYGRTRLTNDEADLSADSFAIEVARRFMTEEEAQQLTVDLVQAAAKPSGKHIEPRRKARDK